MFIKNTNKISEVNIIMKNKKHNSVGMTLFSVATVTLLISVIVNCYSERG